MGLKDRLNKLKNYFTEEVEETEPIKKEVIQVPIPAPEHKETPVIPEEDLTEFKKDEKVNVPIYFDDKDFMDLPKKEKIVPKKEVYKEKTFKKEERKYFRPSPIISPVYGVLDKNYYKEDITQKQTPIRVYDREEGLTLDDVRKKAYGTLEDDLEKNLFGNNSILFNEEHTPAEEDKEIITEEDIFEDLLEESIVPEETPDISIEHTKMEIHYPPKDRVEDIYEQTEEEITESDLFQLIDSMYEGKDEE